MASLQELQKENERLRNMQSKLREMQKNNEDRKRLLKENKQISRDIKFGKHIRLGKSVGRGLAQVGKQTGKEFLKVGKGAVKGLQAYANFLAAQEMKQRSINRRLRSVKKAIKKRKKRKR